MPPKYSPGARRLGAALLLAGIIASAPSLLLAQKPESPNGMSLMMTGPLGLPMSRIGSGTAWLPDSAPMYGSMRSVGQWGVMSHFSVFVQGNAQGGPRGDTQFGSLNWGMLGATHSLAGGRLQLRGMMSVDAFTVGGKGYPLLLQTGESYNGEALHDRQHPHDLFMEIAAVYDRALTDNVAMQLYLAPAGEPASGPVAFPHRPTAVADPFATISHHWQDATHVSFGVATAAVYTRRLKIEGSLFNGREPDDTRTNLDYRRAKLDALAARVTFNPDGRTAMSASFANLPDAEVKHAGESLRRATASVLHTQSRADNGSLSLALIVGANALEQEHWSPSVTAEALRDFRGKMTVFARGEVVRKSSEELVVTLAENPKTLPLPVGDKVHDNGFTLSTFTLGAVRELSAGKLGLLGLGARGTLNLVPKSLSATYGSRTPVGGAVYLRWRPSRMRSVSGMADMKHMHGM